MTTAKKSPKKPVLPETPDEIQEFGEFLTADDINPALERIYSEMGVDGEGRKSQIYVYKEMSDGADARVWAGSPDDYNLEPLTKKFGSGSYRVKVYAEHDSGRMVVKANQVIKILLDPAEDARIAAARNPVTTPQQPQNMDPAAMVTMIAAAIAQAMPKPQAQPDPMQMLAGLAGVLKTIIPQQSPQMPQQINPMDMFKMGIELAGKATGVIEPTEPMTKLIETFGPMFAQTLIQQPQPQQQHTQQPAQIAAPVQQPESPEMLAQMKARAEAAAFKAQLGLLVAKAATNADPLLYAELVADNVPEETLIAFLNNPQWLEYLAQFEPAVKNHAEWFTQLHAAISALFEPDTPDAPPADGQAAAPGVDTGKQQA